VANGDISKLGLRGAGVNARFWCSARRGVTRFHFFIIRPMYVHYYTNNNTSTVFHVKHFPKVCAGN
jgi:hypothetical protein